VSVSPLKAGEAVMLDGVTLTVERNRHRPQAGGNRLPPAN
jgi:hypothetical protein